MRTLAHTCKKAYNIRVPNNRLSAKKGFSMKKLFLALLFAILTLPSLCLAAEPVITSDTRTFNPLSGVYDLSGNVFVQFPAHDTMMTITGDYTQVNIYKMEVHGNSNIKLSYADMNFSCDKVDVYSSQRTAYVSGNLSFKDGTNIITADSGTYNWKTKEASFSGNVNVNGTPQQKDIVYNVLTKQIQ